MEQAALADETLTGAFILGAQSGSVAGVPGAFRVPVP